MKPRWSTKAARSGVRLAPRRPRPRPLGSVTEVGIDTGGTFTDFVARVDGRLVAFKLRSTPAAPERAVLAGLERLGVTRETRVRHGSTVATNTLLERKGARVVLVTTEGFEDLLEIGRQDRPDLYALAPRRPEALVPAERRFGVRERVGPRGQVWCPIDRASLERLVARVRAARPAAIAVGLLHAYARPAHERAIVRRLAHLGLPITRSSEICPEIREYERIATTVTNAYLEPRVSRYVQSVARRTQARIEIVLSHGGTAPPARAAREPVRQLLSGPAAGLRAARDVALACGHRLALTLDVGGTSTDCAFIAGELPRRRAREVGGIPIQLPMLDVHTVGAGGGSIARVDAGGLLEVGPESAGASPGPACYGNGGPATVTDALVALGRIPAVGLADGALTLDRDAALAVMRRLGRELGGLDPYAAALGVLRVAEARMAAALRNVSVERGHDPRAAALVAFGGAGGLHACALAEALDCRAVLFPRHAGVLSAIGALTGGSRRERTRSVVVDARETVVLERGLARLEALVRSEFSQAERAGVRVERWAEVRYRGQSHELSLPVGKGFVARFHREHERRFGFSREEAAVEVVTLEVRGSMGGEARGGLGARVSEKRGAARRAAAGTGARRLPGAPVLGGTTVRVREARGESRARLWRSAELPRGSALSGPAIVLEEGATLWMPRGWKARLHSSGTLELTR